MEADLHNLAREEVTVKTTTRRDRNAILGGNRRAAVVVNLAELISLALARPCISCRPPPLSMEPLHGPGVPGCNPPARTRQSISPLTVFTRRPGPAQSLLQSTTVHQCCRHVVAELALVAAIGLYDSDAGWVRPGILVVLDSDWRSLTGAGLTCQKRLLALALG